MNQSYIAALELHRSFVNSNKILGGGSMVYTVKEIQKLLGIGTASAYELVKRKDFPSISIGRKTVVPKVEFHKWLKSESNKKRA